MFISFLDFPSLKFLVLIKSLFFTIYESDVLILISNDLYVLLTGKFPMGKETVKSLGKNSYILTYFSFCLINEELCAQILQLGWLTQFKYVVKYVQWMVNEYNKVLQLINHPLIRFNHKKFSGVYLVSCTS
jgi:hypothetical protein